MGLRISELITIYSASIKQVGGDTMLIYSTGKLSPEPVEVSKPANQLVVYALDKIKDMQCRYKRNQGFHICSCQEIEAKKATRLDWLRIQIGIRIICDHGLNSIISEIRTTN